MLNTEDLNHIVNALQEANEQDRNHRIEQGLKEELSEQEAFQIYNEILAVFSKHNVSYRMACNISISTMYALITGAAELYNADNS